MNISQKLAELSANVSALVQSVTGINGRVDAAVASVETEANQRLNALEAGLKSHMPIAPNLLADTKIFATLCGGAKNVEQPLVSAHADSAFSAFLYGGSTGVATFEVVTPDQFAAKGLAIGGDLARLAAGGSGVGFNVVLMNVNLTGNTVQGQVPRIYALNQGGEKFTDWNKGEFKTQASCFVNVLEQSGDIGFWPFFNGSPGISVTGAQAGQGWSFQRATRTGFGGHHQPHFAGAGSMKVALALPYWATGDHGDLAIFAGSVGRFTHGDRLPSGVKF
ncbi:MAG: hypothetical protein N4A70_05590 [Pelagimonas sp.]|jgi:hypothetical protein|nr:hypothetical protein [Pelagimonas sp.]